MLRKIGVCVVAAALAFMASAQTTVTTTGGTTYNIPKFSGSSTLVNSAIFENNSNVGIGISNPTQMLHLYNAGNNAPVLLMQSGGQGYPGLFFQNTAGFYANQISGVDGSLYWWNNTTKNMVLLQNGNLGLGTASPTGILTIASPANDRLGTPAQGIMFVDSFQGDPPWGQAAIYGVGSTGYNGNLVFATDGDGLNDTALTEKMRIGFDGKVGIGTTTPGELLEVNGNVKVTGIRFSDNSLQTTASAGSGSSNAYPAITEVGANVGIGTTTPLQKLSISNGSVGLDGFGFISSQRSTSNGYTNLFLGGGIADNGNGTYTVATDGGSNFFAAIRMDYAGGNAGAISFFSQQAVSGSSYSLTNSALSGYQRMTLVGGNLGIGTASPAARLEVAGNIKLSSGSGASMTFQDNSVQTVAWNGVLSGGDYAESVDVIGDRTTYEPGDVLVIDPAAEGKFLKSSEPYSTTVTGIYSTKPGVVGRRQLTARAQMKEELPMAMIGIVPTKVNAENGPIKPGDLLVTSSTPGYAMKGTDRTQMLGAVIGKALGHLDSGIGIIEVVVSLQ